MTTNNNALTCSECHVDVRLHHACGGAMLMQKHITILDDHVTGVLLIVIYEIKSNSNSNRRPVTDPMSGTITIKSIST